jgi:hypothetical protein
MKTFAAKTALLSTLLCVSVAGALPGAAWAQTSSPVAPTLIPVSGRLLTAQGQAQTGTVNLTISLYDGQADASPRWIEQQLGVPLDPTGAYSIQFGATLPDGLPGDLFTTEGGTRWLGVTVEGAPEQPRVMLLSVPYAAKAASAETLGGKSASDFVLSSTFREDLRTVLQEEGVTGGEDVGVEAITPGSIQKGAPGNTTTDALNFVEAGGNVGIGTMSPGARLHVAGGMTYLTPSAGGASQGVQLDTVGLPNGSNAFYFNAPTGWAGNYFKANLNSAEVFAIRQNGGAWFNGNVGVGVVSPGAKLHVAGGMTYLQPASTGANQGVQIDTGGLPNGSNAIFVNAPGGWAGNYFKANLAGAETFAINASGSAWFNGNVGVGTASPAAKLHVVGNATFTGNVVVDGNIAAKYQDVAEWVDSAEPLEAGTVVIIDPTGSNRVMGAAKAYESSVAGAVSPQPGLTLGEPGEGRVLVAQSGRVRVKADATYGAIRAGDLLVTSKTKGYVMKSQPIKVGGQFVHRPGTLVGKALESLEKGQGEILVLLTLQ